MIGVDRTIRLISLDPGSNALGLAVSEFNLDTQEKKVLYTRTLDLKEGLKNLRYMEEAKGTKFVKLKLIGDFLKVNFEDWQPDAVIMESPFAGKFIQAYKVLVEVMFIIEKSVSRYGDSIPLYKIDPPTVKKTHGVPGNSGDKELMRQAVKRIPKLTLGDGVNFDAMSEHEIDAVAVGNYFYVVEISV